MVDITLFAPCGGWITSLDNVPDEVFAARLIGDGVAIEPLTGNLHAPCDGTIIAVAASLHSITLEIANGAQVLIHIGIDTVAMDGSGFELLVAVGQAVKTGEPLIIFDLDQILLDAKGLITPILIVNSGYRITPLANDMMVRTGVPMALVEHIIDRVPDHPILNNGGSDQRDSAQCEAVVLLQHGIHARPAAQIVGLLTPFSCEVQITIGGRNGNARSIVGLLGLAIRQGQTLSISAQGPDAQVAVSKVAAIIEGRVNELKELENNYREQANALEKSGPVCAAPGLAIGRVFQFRKRTIEIIEAGISIEYEKNALSAAVDSVGKAIRSFEGVSSGIAQAHEAILNDPTLHALAMSSISEGKSAAAAWRDANVEQANIFNRTGDLLVIERIADLEDISHQIFLALGCSQAKPYVVPQNSVIIVDELLPSEFLGLANVAVQGIVTARGGPTSHVALLASASGIPMIVAAGADVLYISDGQTIIVDADKPQFILDPSEEDLSNSRIELESRRTRYIFQRASALANCQTSDGTRIKVFANLGSQADVEAAVGAGAEGCGLLRSEFLFLESKTAPSEMEQRDVYQSVANALGERPLIIRTLDIGADKPVPYVTVPREENPALGLRGIRLSLDRPDMLATQFRAIAAGVLGDQCRIMLPMIVDTTEFLQARKMLDEATAAVGRADRISLGVMVETPSAAILADKLAYYADFLSIGSNDLTQYTLAIDRGHPKLAAQLDSLHPAVLLMIAMTVDGARKHNRWVGVCGGLASIPRAAPLLVGLGITELSAVTSAIPAVKAILRSVSLNTCEAIAQKALAMSSPSEVHALLKEW